MGLACLKQKNQVRRFDDGVSDKQTAQDWDNGMQWAERQAFLTKFLNEVAQTSDTAKVLHMLVNATCAMLDCECASLFLKEYYSTSLAYCRAPTDENLSPCAHRSTLQSVEPPGPEDGVVGRVWATGKSANIPNTNENCESDSLGARGARPFQLASGTRSVLCMPFKDAQGQVLGVLQVSNKRAMVAASETSSGQFDSDDETLVTMLLAVAVRQRMAHDFVKRKKKSAREDRAGKKFDSLLAILSASLLVSKTKDLKSLIKTILLSSQILMECDRCSLHAVDHWQKQLVGYTCCDEDDLDETRMPMKGIFAEVATLGEILNIPDAWSDERFIRDSDRETGYRTRSMLIVPLATSKGKVVAVLTCCNKKDGAVFCDHDQKELAAVSALVGDVLQRILLDESLVALFAESNEDNDLKDMLGNYVSNSIYDDCPSSRVLVRLDSRKSTLKSADAQSYVQSMQRWDFDHWSEVQPQRPLTDAAYINACLMHLELLSEFKVKKEAVAHCVKRFKDRYINTNPYHNWSHGFATFHVLFAMMCSGVYPLEVIPTLDHFATLLAALGHDVEHPGFNNQFLVNNRDMLALRYNDISVLESHHASVSCTILGEEIFNSFTAPSAARFRKVVVATILGTDMSNHHTKVAWLQTTEVDVLGEETLEPDVALKVGSLMLHTADLSHPTLPWKLHCRLSIQCTEEFYAQSQEEERLGLPSLPFMGKDPTVLAGFASTQVGFMKFVAMPLWQALPCLIPDNGTLETILETLNKNQDTWQRIADGELIVDRAGEEIVPKEGTALE